jgi:hypothetical protein
MPPELPATKPNTAPSIVFWFKYLLSVYTVVMIAVSSMDGKLSAEEIQNGGVVIGVWATSGDGNKEKEEEIDKELDEISDKLDKILKENDGPKEK